MAATRIHLQQRQDQANKKRKFEALTAEPYEPLTATDNTFYETAEKRQQKFEFFKPWLLEDKNQDKKHKAQHTLHDAFIVQYNPNKMRAFQAKKRTPKEQRRRDQNTSSCLLLRRAKKIEDATIRMELLDYREQQEDMDEILVRHHLYLKELLSHLNLASMRRFNLISSNDVKL